MERNARIKIIVNGSLGVANMLNGTHGLIEGNIFRVFLAYTMSLFSFYVTRKVWIGDW